MRINNNLNVFMISCLLIIYFNVNASLLLQRRLLINRLALYARHPYNSGTVHSIELSSDPTQNDLNQAIHGLFPLRNADHKFQLFVDDRRIINKK